MAHEPQIEQRAAQPYVAIPAHVRSEAEFRRAADRGFPELFRWLAEHGVAPDGPVFIRYLVLDPEGQPLDIELAVGAGDGVSGDARVRVDALPPGRWVTFLHVGPYNSATTRDLADARAMLDGWMDRHGIALDRRATERGVVLGGRVERYLTGPVEEPDYSRWQTELAYLTAQGEAERS